MTEIDRAKLYRDIRQRLIERLDNIGIIPRSAVETMSLYQIVGLLFLLVGQTNYLATWTLTVHTLDELLGNQLWERADTQVQPDQPKVVN